MYPGRVITYLIDWAYHQYVKFLLWKNGQTSQRSTPSKFQFLNHFITPTSNVYFAGRPCTCCQPAPPTSSWLEISSHCFPRPPLLIGGDDLLCHLHQNLAEAGPSWRCRPSYWTRSRLGICLRRVKVGKSFTLCLLCHSYLFWISIISSSRY